MREYITVKEWIYDKIQSEASAYRMFLNIGKRNENGAICRENGHVVLIGTKIKETEKAVQIRFETGEIDGSVKGWLTWVPKSQLA